MTTAKTKWTRHNPNKWTVFYTSDCGCGEIKKLPHYFVLFINGKRFVEDTLPGCKEVFEDFINDTKRNRPDEETSQTNDNHSGHPHDC